MALTGSLIGVYNDWPEVCWYILILLDVSKNEKNIYIIYKYRKSLSYSCNRAGLGHVDSQPWVRHQHRVLWAKLTQEEAFTKDCLRQCALCWGWKNLMAYRVFLLKITRNVTCVLFFSCNVEMGVRFFES